MTSWICTGVWKSGGVGVFFAFGHKEGRTVESTITIRRRLPTPDKTVNQARTLGCRREPCSRVSEVRSGVSGESSGVISTLKSSSGSLLEEMGLIRLLIIFLKIIVHDGIPCKRV